MSITMLYCTVNNEEYIFQEVGAYLLEHLTEFNNAFFVQIAIPLIFMLSCYRTIRMKTLSNDIEHVVTIATLPHVFVHDQGVMTNEPLLAVCSLLLFLQKGKKYMYVREPPI